MRQQGVKATIDDVCKNGQNDGVHCDSKPPTPDRVSRILTGSQSKLAETGQEWFSLTDVTVTVTVTLGPYFW
jgi:hypothetical protein